MRARPITARVFFFAIALGLVFIGFAPTLSVFSSGSNSPALLFTAAKGYEGLAWMHGGERFSSDATIFLQDAGGQRPLVPGFSASADPAVSFDGKRVLFAGKQNAGDHWQIWEVELSTSAPLRVISCTEDCIRPLYLPDDRVVYAKKTGGRFVIETADVSAGKTVQSMVQLTYGPGNFLPTDVLQDGRILFEATYPLGSDGTPEVYTVYADGSGVESYRCDHGKARFSGRQIGSGDVVFASGVGAGGSGLGRFTSARAQGLDIAVPRGEYAGDVSEILPGEWLLAWRGDATGYFQVKRWKPGRSDLVTVIEEQNRNAVQPTLVAERGIPKRHPSGLHDWPSANLLCLNAYTSKYKFGAGSVHTVRLYTRDDTGSAKLLGAAPVERDGSFFVQVPTELPLQIELLDGSGKTLKREAGWFWMRRGEQRGCVGCHAGPETSPENAVPMVLLKSTAPADMTGTSTRAASGGH